jgi:multiple sugar transport system substrate-binding protein
MKKSLVILMLIVFTVSFIFTGCGKAATPTPGTTTQAAGTTPATAAASSVAQAPANDGRVLQYWCSWGGDSQKWDQWRVGEFTKATGIKVNNQYVEPDAGITNGKLIAAIAGGNPPDTLVTSAYSESYTYAAQGSLLPWDQYMPDMGISPATMLPAFKQLMEYNGKTYIMPQDSNVLFLYYNPAMFTEAGLDPAKPPKTLAELDAYAAKLTKKAADGTVERFGFIPWVDNGGDAYLWPWMFGSTIFDNATKQLKLTDDKMVACYNWMNTYAKKYNPEKMKAFVSGFGGMFTPDHPFMKGKVAMTITGNWFTHAMELYAPNVKYMVAAIPTPDGGRTGGTPLNSNVFLLPKGAKNPDLAAQFFKFIISPTINANNFDTWHSIPVRDADFDQVSWTKKGDPTYALERQLANSPNAGHPALTSVSAQLATELNALRDNVIYNNKDPKPLLEALQNKLQPEVK